MEQDAKFPGMERGRKVRKRVGRKKKAKMGRSWVRRNITAVVLRKSPLVTATGRKQLSVSRDCELRQPSLPNREPIWFLVRKKISGMLKSSQINTLMSGD